MAASKQKPLLDTDDDLEDDVLLATVVEGESDFSDTLESIHSLNYDQKARTEKNRLKAVALKKSRLVQRPELRKSEQLAAAVEKKGEEGQKKKTESAPNLVDSGAGFFIEAEASAAVTKIKHLPAPILESDRLKCLECSDEFADSYLLRTFDYQVCDKCRDLEKDGKHSFITKTDAKTEFLLKDFDFDKRQPPLKFIVRKNPHNPRWGDMKLFLRLQVEKRALEVWQTEEALEEAHDAKEDRREKVKANKFGKKLKALRMQMRGSLYQKKDYRAVSGGHIHDYDDQEEKYDEENDEYTRTCKTCGYTNTYEQM